MPQAFAARSSSEHHTAQQSRRDKLRVQQQHQFVDGGSNPNPNQSVNNINHQELIIYSCATNTNMLTNPSAIYDLAVPGGHDWIANQISSSTGHPFLQSHLYHKPASAEMISARDTLQAMVTPSTPTSSGLDIASQMEVDGGFGHGAVASATQGLSLSLASKPHAELHAAGHSQFNYCSNPPQAKLLVDPRRAVGHLGPFIGYAAAVLKSSKFVRPAQQLLDGFCSAVTGSKFARQAQCDHHLAVHERRNSVGGSVGDYGGDGSTSVRGWNSGVSSSSFYSSTEGGNGSEGGAGGGANCSIQQQPETQQKKVKLLYLQEEVSNWFINARVRLWKPMVEEIHVLESKGMAEMDLNSTHKNDGKRIMDDGRGQPYCDQGSEVQSNKPLPLDCSSATDHATHESSSIISMEQRHSEKRSRMEECTLPGSMDEGLMSIAYQGTIGGLGAVSLTLGPRHSEDLQQQQQQQQQQMHFGSQMLRDFVG